MKKTAINQYCGLFFFTLSKILLVLFPQQIVHGFNWVKG